MATLCYGEDRGGERLCPIRENCYRYTQPTPGRDRLGALPFDFATQRCDLFISNTPDNEHVRTAAYYLWLRLGRPEGQAELIWQRAMREAETSTGRAPKPS
jgi:hypothetical protein